MKVQYSPLQGARTPDELQAIFDAIATASASVEVDNLRAEGLDRFALVNRPVWERGGTLTITTRNAAALAVGAVMADVVHNAVPLGFTFAAFIVPEGDRLRFGSWITWESTLANGLGFSDGDLRLQWSNAGVKLTGSGGGMERGPFPNGPTHHGQTYIEGEIAGPAVVNGDVRVQYTLAAAGARGFVSRSVTWWDRLFRV